MRPTDLQRIRGVYETPGPLVRYVVRSVHVLLQTRLGFSQGLADPRVRLLDPAAGAMNFIRAACRTAGRSADLRSRCLGIEILPDVQARGLIRADALAPPPELLDRSFNVVIGNPPWRGRSSNRGPWITGLLREYFQVDGQRLGERNPKWLQDDYVKFLRLAQWLIERNGEGIVAFVLNHNFLEAPTFRGLRRSLLRTVEEIYVLDLHGNARRGEDGNVFAGVAQGAAVVFLVKKAVLPKRLLRADLQGNRQEKLKVLDRSDIDSTPWTEIEPQSPGYLFVRGDRALAREFERGALLPEIFPVHGTGIVTGRDAEVTAFDRGTLISRFGKKREHEIQVFLARPFDLRFILYAEGFLERPRRGLMTHMMDGDNIGLAVTRQCKGEPGALVTRWMIGHKVLCPYDVSSLFPLYLGTGTARRPNLTFGLREKLGHWYGEEPTPEEVLGYVYAVLSNESYRQRYRELLRRSFPRITFPRDPRLFAPVSALGRELIGLQLLQDVRLHDRLPQEIEPDLWEVRIGGYPVLRQWLRARRGRDLGDAESLEMQRIGEALRLMLEVQSALEEAAA
jgi:predicted helicase